VHEIDARGDAASFPPRRGSDAAMDQRASGVDHDAAFGDDRLHVRILQAREVSLWPWWRYPQRIDTFWRLYRHRGDGAGIRWNGRLIELPSRRIVFVPANVAFGCVPAPDVVQLYLHADPLGPLAAALSAIAKPVVLPYDALLDQLADRVAAALRDGRTPGALSCAKGLWFAALARVPELLPRAEATRCLELMRGTSPVHEALRFIEEHLADPVDNRHLAAMCGLGVDVFIRAFRRQVGSTPTAWRIGRQVAVAAQRLRFGDEPVAAIARACGFASRHYFSRAFRARLGCSPAAFRRRSAPR
jgi:AraC-like DNA-binding protein